MKLTAKENGEANEYTLMDANNWLASVRMNGEKHLHEQRTIMERFVLTTATIEETSCEWICERWATGLKIESSSYWTILSDHMHCAAMAVWEINAVQRLEYLDLATLAAVHSLILTNGSEGVTA